jgi:Glutaredoxin-like domain (DUF836)
MSAGRVFTLYSRPGCHLCEDMLAALGATPAAAGVPVGVRDVDQDPQVRARYGHKIPVLLLDGELVCHGRLDAAELHKALALDR